MFGDERMVVVYVQFNTGSLPFAFLGLSERYQIMPITITKQKPLRSEVRRAHTHIYYDYTVRV